MQPLGQSKIGAEQEGRLSRKTRIDVDNFFLRGPEQALLQTKSSNAEARALLERAIAISPNFAAAYAFVANMAGGPRARARETLTPYRLATSGTISERRAFVFKSSLAMGGLHAG